jgi:hypothetical protein
MGNGVFEFSFDQSTRLTSIAGVRARTATHRRPPANRIFDQPRQLMPWHPAAHRVSWRTRYDCRPVFSPSRPTTPESSPVPVSAGRRARSDPRAVTACPTSILLRGKTPNAPGSTERRLVAVTDDNDLAYCIATVVNTIGGNPPPILRTAVRKTDAAPSLAIPRVLPGGLADTLSRYTRNATVVNDLATRRPCPTRRLPGRRRCSSRGL